MLMFHTDPPVEPQTRRSFIQRSMVATTMACSGGLAHAIPAVPARERARAHADNGNEHPLNKASKVRRLRLANEASGETLDVVYWRDDQYIADNVGQLNYFMRDLHVNKSFLMDPKLYDFMYKLQKTLKASERIHVLSGYRTPATNAELRKMSMGAALRSLHVRGRAVDFYLPGHDLQDVQKAARHLVLGGVGYYPRSGFVHIDTGFARHWEQSSA